MTTSTDTTIRQQVQSYLSTSLSRPVADDENIFAAGLVNSLFAVQLVTFVESEFAVAVDIAELDLANFCSIDAITAYVLSKR